MRIVHLISYFQPRLGYQETHLARQQVLRGHDVTVVCSDRYYPFPDYDGTIRPLLGERIVGSGRTVEDGIPTWRLPVRYENEAHKRCWMRSVKGALEALRPDVVHAHGVAEFSTIQAAWLQRRKGFRLLIDGHDMWVTVKRDLVGRTFYAAFRTMVTPLLVSRAEALVGVTDQSAEIMRTVMGMDRIPVSVIELGVDAERFVRDEAAGRAVRERLGVAAHDFLVLYTGKLIPSKDPRLILEALARCPSDVKALFVGNGTEAYRTSMAESIGRYALEDRVHFEPAVPQAELPRYYSAADVACWPREASMAMLEAASCMVPIVVVKGGLEARIANQNGLEYTEGDVSELAAMFCRLRDDRHGARKMGMRGRQLIEASFTWQQVNLAFEALYAKA
jgi:glycosyltransferase involved in cell wall biosynthesis